MTQNISAQQANTGKRPMYELQKCVNKTVKVKLKNMVTYRGVLVKVDMYMNIYLQKAEEYDESGKAMASYGDVIIRGNNILYVEIENGIFP